MTRLGSRAALLVVAISACLVLAACGSSDSTSTSVDRPAAPPSLAKPCGRKSAPPARYEHVVVIMEENRTWTGGRTPAVGMGFSGGKMPFLAGLATKCAYYEDWAETNASQNSLNQYIGLTSGVANTSTVNDCEPSDTCRSLDDNIFRQVRRAGGSARSYVDGATQPCSAGTNKAKHIPALYFQGGNDASYCKAEVRPMDDFDPDHLPTFAFITPDQCHDGHDCTDDKVDAWAEQLLTSILDGQTYRSGKTLVAIGYDEDQPVPNLLIAPTARPGRIEGTVGSHAALLKTIEELLGLPVMKQGQLPEAISLRKTAHL